MKRGKPLLTAFVFALICGASFLFYDWFTVGTITKAGIIGMLVDMIIVFFGMWWFYSHAKKANNQ